MSTIAKEYVKPVVISRIVKKALCERFERKNVRVRGGRGTAYGWIDATVEISKPSDCYCAEREGYGHCSRCSEALKGANESGRKIVYARMKEANAEFSTYYADDGYNTQRDEFILQIRFISESNES